MEKGIMQQQHSTHKQMIHLAIVVGARPNFMKAAPLIWNIHSKYADTFVSTLIHTGQHFSPEMSDVFFRDLDMPSPDHYLGVHSPSSNTTIARIMLSLEPLLLDLSPDVVIVVGDVNSTLAAALTANKLGIKLAHVEAGLRSFDRSMPEEINRILTDHLSDVLFTHSDEANENLIREGIHQSRIFLVGNVMADTLYRFLPKARKKKVYQVFNLPPNKYAVLTLHRPSNVDHVDKLRGIIRAILEISQHIPVIFPVHPRTQKNLSLVLTELQGKFPHARLILSKPLSYIDFLSLSDSSMFIMTDSGGIQEEATLLKKPCLTLRENTERPVTVSMGTNKIVGTDPERIVHEALRLLTQEETHAPLSIPPLWDGKAGGRILSILKELFL